VRLLTALVEIDADGDEVEWKHMEDFHYEMERLPVLRRRLEDELRAREVRA
jgi:hypothetical protein